MTSLKGTWAKKLSPLFETPQLKSLKKFLEEESLQKKKLYPPMPLLFQAFHLTPFENVKVVIIGQDPYHNPHQAHGLSFSVPKGVPIPPSLRNIFQELSQDLKISLERSSSIDLSGDLTPWAKEGVLLLNSILTVQENLPASHQNKGWEFFTDSVIQILNEEKTSLVFFLWGSFAWKKGEKINTQKHCVLKAPHPSPLSAYRGFFGSRPFSKANSYLSSQNISPIDWNKIIES